MPDNVSPLFLQLTGAEGAVGGHAAGVRRGDAPGAAVEGNTALQLGRGAPRLQAALGQAGDERGQKGSGSSVCSREEQAGKQGWVLSAGLPLAGERSGWGSLFLCPCPTHRQPEGAKRARVTQLPSTKLLEQQLSRRHAVSVSLLLAVSPKHWSSSQAPEASLLTFFHSFSFVQWRTSRARSLEALLERHAKVRLAAFHPPLAVLGCR